MTTSSSSAGSASPEVTNWVAFRETLHGLFASAESILDGSRDSTVPTYTAKRLWKPEDQVSSAEEIVSLISSNMTRSVAKYGAGT